MVTEFAIRVGEGPDIATLARAIDLPDLVFADTDGHPREGGALPRETTLVYVDRVSTRPVVVEVDGQEVRIEAKLGSCESSVEVARRLALAVARHAGQAIDTPEGVLDADAFAARFDAGWSTRESERMFAYVLRMVQEAPNGKVALPLLGREYTLSQKFLDRLGECADVREAVFSRMRTMNYIEKLEPDVYVNGMKCVPVPDGPPGSTSTSWSMIPTMAWTGATYYSVLTSRMERTRIPSEVVLRVLGDRVRWLSDDYVILPHIEAHDEASFHRAAKKVTRILGEAATYHPSDEYRDIVRAAVDDMMSEISRHDVPHPVIVAAAERGIAHGRLATSDMVEAQRVVDVKVNDDSRKINVYAFAMKSNVPGESVPTIIVEAAESNAPHAEVWAQRYGVVESSGRIEKVGSLERIGQVDSRFGKFTPSTELERNKDALAARVAVAIVATGIVTLSSLACVGWAKSFGDGMGVSLGVMVFFFLTWIRPAYRSLRQLDDGTARVLNVVPERRVGSTSSESDT